MMLGQAFPQHYPQQLSKKHDQLAQQLAPFHAPELAVYASKPAHYRMRAEFRLWHEGESLHYVMFDPNTKKPITITDYSIGSPALYRIMPLLLDALQANPVLKHRLFQVEFLSVQSGDMIVTLVYHRPLDAHWETAARELAETLRILVIGRSKKQKIVLSCDYLIEQFQVNGRSYHYQHKENTFTQPNATLCQAMLEWALASAKHCGKNDLLELYCGHANFTCVLASHFRQVLATEVSKASVASAQYNLARNLIDNVSLARLSAEEIGQALQKTRVFRRLHDIDLTQYQFDTILVDPPRAGLDSATLAFVSQFPHIMYISCNPDTLANNLQTLHQTHTIKRCALFDQFPYTPHIESGILLTHRR